jgi:hypothetical protein
VDVEVEVAEIFFHEGLVVGAVDAADVDGADLRRLKRLGEQGRHHGRVGAARQREEDAATAYGGADFFDLAPAASSAGKRSLAPAMPNTKFSSIWRRGPWP